MLHDGSEISSKRLSLVVCVDQAVVFNLALSAPRKRRGFAIKGPVKLSSKIMLHSCNKDTIKCDCGRTTESAPQIRTEKIGLADFFHRQRVLRVTSSAAHTGGIYER